MNLIYDDNKIILKDQKNFDPAHIFKCGQAFRWTEEEDKSFTNIAFGKVINVKKVDNDIYIKNTSQEDFNKIWKDYFDLNRNYEELRKELSIDNILKEALEFGDGIRILNQEVFETLITFIISANNQIPRIKNSISIISQMYGNEIEAFSEKYYSFPSPEKLALAKVEDLREYARVGFRDERIVKASQMIANGEINIDSIFTADLKSAREELMKLPGVGPKVADCVLLFAFKRSESFPVDVWIKRVMEELYLKENTSKNLVAEHGRRIFGKNAGFAQQYLFFYGRENKLGR